MVKATPMVRQYLSIKQQYPDAILFYRMGDFYEMFFEDAKIASRILEIALTSRNKKDEEPIPMCGVPHHAAQSYIARLIERGFKVAICEQVEDPAKAKGLVNRDVVRVITPGVVVDTEILDAKFNNFLMALSFWKGRYGIAHLDISTGTFRVTESSHFDKVIDECRRIDPRESLLAESHREAPEIKALVEILGETSVNFLKDECFELESAQARLLRQFRTHSLEGFGCHEWRAGIAAAGALLRYVDETHKGELGHITGISSYSLSDFMVVDETSKRNLELFETIRTGTKRGSLLGIMDQTVTAMGARMLRAWLQYPLLDLEQIKGRLDAIEEAKEKLPVRRSVRKALQEVHDLQRLNARIALDRCNARDLVALKHSIQRLPKIRSLLDGFESRLFVEIISKWDDLGDVAGLIEDAISDDPPLTIREGGIIKPGFDGGLDELIRSSREGKDWISRLQARERQATGINSLKVGFNKVFGYYIEVSKTHIESVPAHYVRKQTLVNAERYITEDLKAYEAKVLGAEEKRAQLEYELFCVVREKVAQSNSRISRMADVVSHLDVLLAMAELADQNGYVKPVVHDGDSLFLKESRHPVIEKLVSSERFVPNTIEMDHTSRQVLIITGPNMAGKSTLLRQVALLVLMAQMGSFVPAEAASIGIVDRIFTRVGALDSLAEGKSTFMVEMQETANILNNATEKSLVILDEIGRGTSTFDGLSIAWAVAEYLHEWKGHGIKALFATHYHELTDLALTKPRVKNYNVAVKEWNEEVIFLRKLVEGSTNRSYGIQVARLAGIPAQVLERAKEILKNIESGELNSAGEPVLARSKRPVDKDGSVQLSLFKTSGEIVINTLKKLDISNMTPLEALNQLNALKELMEDL
ncbi:MAG: DNA mismatch repair protein MutS [Deltaproteobacteria bacterium]|nr:DNA mismatch repair protein MutS [Deltaproteobacteria bacterium]MBW2018390.1 DNA mismatch repair protein MutS [Deltaproteobacteria bacterium]MBW2073676.1 DNA mismatch repair protein MutS [Deltaproteobacteria bacterium]RLB82801.1 MAG: DNA mismatch repair protein MutS [Deltaproteobacteria bacterium]